MRQRSKRGFTLLELLVVMTLIAILSTIGIVGYRQKVKTSQEAVLKENIFQINHCLEQYRTDRGRYPSSLNALVEMGYLRSIPMDPITNSRETWQSEMEPSDPDNPNVEIGVWKVRSGSTEVGTNGIPYNEWGS